MRKFLFAVLGLVIVAALAGYIASPYFAFHRLQDAAKTGDRDGLEATVDFPAVRDDFKAQLNAAFMAKMQSDPGMKDNPFAAVGLLLVPAVIGHVIDSYITPQGIALMVAKARTPQQGARPSGGESGHVSSHYGYVSIDRFQAVVTNDTEPGQSLTFVMERRGLFTWKLIRIELPIGALK
jgi:hypothetical protein